MFELIALFMISNRCYRLFQVILFSAERQTCTKIQLSIFFFFTDCLDFSVKCIKNCHCVQAVQYSKFPLLSSVCYMLPYVSQVVNVFASRQCAILAFPEYYSLISTSPFSFSLYCYFREQCENRMMYLITHFIRIISF